MEIRQIDSKWGLIAGGILLVIVIAIAVIRDRNYQKLIDGKEKEISKLSEQVFQHEADFKYWKGQAEDIAKRVIVVGRKIEQGKKFAAEKKNQMDSIIVPTGSVEIAGRLKEHYPSIGVRCDGK